MAALTKQARKERSIPMINVENMAHEALAHHSHFRRHADEFEFDQRGDVLTVRGRVPSFYLKQVLQTVLVRLDGIRVVDNRVDVVSSEGPSSVADTRNVSGIQAQSLGK